MSADNPLPTSAEDESVVLARLSQTPAEAYERGYLDGAARERERLRVDAERYRWLRDPNNMHAREIVRYYGDVEASELDAAIDAAMNADKEP